MRQVVEINMGKEDLPVLESAVRLWFAGIGNVIDCPEGRARIELVFESAFPEETERPISQDRPILFDEEEAARLMACSVRDVKDLRERGRLRVFKIGSSPMYTRAELERYILSQMSEEF